MTQPEQFIDLPLRAVSLDHKFKELNHGSALPWSAADLVDQYRPLGVLTVALAA